MKSPKKGIRLLRVVLCPFFVLVTIALAHLDMIILDHQDLKVSAETYQLPGTPAKWEGDRSLSEKTRLVAERKSGEERELLLTFAQRVENGEEVDLRMLPVSTFLKWNTFLHALLGFALLIASRFVPMKYNLWQTILGLFAGWFLWTGLVEYALMIASRILGIAKSVQVVGGKVVGAYGEYVLLKWSWGFIALIFVILLFHESNRCPFFRGLRKWFGLMRGKLAHGQIDNYGPRTAYEYIGILWAFYVLLLLAYDDSIFGIYSWFTYLVLIGSLGSTGYLLIRLYHQSAWGPALRYAIGPAMVLWNDVEILGKWGVFNGPWHNPDPLTLLVLVLATLLCLGLMVFALKQEKKRKAAVAT